MLGAAVSAGSGAVLGVAVSAGTGSVLGVAVSAGTGSASGVAGCAVCADLDAWVPIVHALSGPGSKCALEARSAEFERHLSLTK